MERKEVLKKTTVYHIEFNQKRKRIIASWDNDKLGWGQFVCDFDYNVIDDEGMGKDFCKDVIKKIKSFNTLNDAEYIILKDKTEIDVVEKSSCSYVSYKINKNKQLVEHVDYDDHGSGYCYHRHYWKFMDKVDHVFLTKKDYDEYKEEEQLWNNC